MESNKPLQAPARDDYEALGVPSRVVLELGDVISVIIDVIQRLRPAPVPRPLQLLVQLALDHGLDRRSHETGCGPETARTAIGRVQKVVERRVCNLHSP
jgi:hypothetical protein